MFWNFFIVDAIIGAPPTHLCSPPPSPCLPSPLAAWKILNKLSVVSNLVGDRTAQIVIDSNSGAFFSLFWQEEVCHICFFFSSSSIIFALSKQNQTRAPFVTPSLFHILIRVVMVFMIMLKECPSWALKERCWLQLVMHHVTEICFKKWVFRRFCHCANITEWPYTNLDGIACYTPRLQTCAEYCSYMYMYLHVPTCTCYCTEYCRQW